METGRLVVLSQGGAEGECYPLGEKLFTTIGRAGTTSSYPIFTPTHRPRR
jgi:hypothetical protein